MNTLPKKTRLSIITFVSISAIIIALGFIGVSVFVDILKDSRIDQQLDLNKRKAETVSKLLSNQIRQGMPPDKILNMFQDAIIGSQVEEGYLCMFDQNETKVLCHPDTLAVGMSVDGENFKFEKVVEKTHVFLGNVVSSSKQEGGILTYNGEEKSEITYMVPVEGMPWKISVHENIKRIEENINTLRFNAYLSFLILALIIAIVSTYASRSISNSYEKQIEEKNRLIEKQNQGLEQKVKERTQELEVAKAKLENLEKAKSDFLGIISHELRTPLNGIMGYTDILATDLKGTVQEEYVKDLKESGLRLLKFSETALLITELTSDRHEMKVEMSSPTAVFNAVKEKFEGNIQEKNIQFKKTTNNTDVKFRMAPDLIKICFENILDNAIRYCPKNGKIDIKSLLTGNQFICEMIDSGPGFSEESMQKLFDFFGADQVMHHSEGFGLGLAASKLIMNAHNGSIEISNREEGGASVKLIFNIDV